VTPAAGRTGAGLAPAHLLPWAVVGLLALLPLAVQDAYTMRLVNIIGINCLLALGLNLVIGVAGQLDAGQAGFYAIGAYTAGILGVSFGVPFWVTVVVAAVGAGLMAFVIGPVLRLRGVFLAVATLAFGEIVRIVISNWIPVTRGPNGIPGIPFPSLGAFVFDTDQRYYYLILAWVLICYAVVARMADSRVGRAMKAVRDNQDAAEVMGVHAIRYKIMAFVVAGAFAGIAGALLAHLQSYISPENFTFLTSIDIIFMVVLGGLGSAPGSVVGAFVVTVAPEWLRFLKDYRIIVYALIILSVLIFAPRGLYGAIEGLRRRLLRRAEPSGTAAG
jgi:branched-chain amino acid transport system permease protein